MERPASFGIRTCGRAALALMVVLGLAGLRTSQAKDGAVAEAPAKVAAPATAARAAAIVKHVAWLCDDARKGRAAWPEREATAAYMADAFGKAGLVPATGRSSMFQDLVARAEPDAEGSTPPTGEPAAPVPTLRNVVAMLPGQPVTGVDSREHVIISAHFDHLGVRDGKAHHGADDNASGVACLLELATMMRARAAKRGKPYKRSLLFVGFDLEEVSVQGSRFYVKAPALPTSKLATFVTMDQMGRSLADLLPGGLFLMGSENSAAIDGHVRAMPEPVEGSKIVLGIDFQPGYSDYVPFREARLPYLFVTSGACRDYHQATDLPDRLDPQAMARRTNWVADLLERLLDAEERPTFRNPPAPTVAEITTLRGLLAVARKGIAAMPGVPPMAATMVQNFENHLGTVIADDVVTKAERENARAMTLNLFQMAMRMMR